MSYFAETAAGAALPAIEAFRDRFGFVPKVFSAQSALPRLIEAEAGLLSSILFSDSSLSRAQKECILFAVAAAKGNSYCFSLHYQMLKLLGLTDQRLDRIASGYEQADLTPANKALLRFTLKLVNESSSLTLEDVNEAQSCGLTSAVLLDAVLATSLGCMMCTLSAGVGAPPDFGFRQPGAPLADDSAHRSPPSERKCGLFFPLPELKPDDFAPVGWLRERIGFVPQVFQALSGRADVLEAEIRAVLAVLVPEDALTRRQKERLLLVTPGSKDIPTERDEALAAFADKLAGGRAFSVSDIRALQMQWFTDVQILEAVFAIALAGFFELLQFGLGAPLDFAARWISQSAERRKDLKIPHLSSSLPRHTELGPTVDPDAANVERVRGGDLDSFEELMNRHGQRIYRTLIGILGNPDDARDAMQDTFLKAFQHLARFEGRSKFSTWLLSIANNTGIQRLRERQPTESLDDSGSDEEMFRPRSIQTWTDGPEQLYSKVETRSLVERAVVKLPAKYRVVLMLRDIEQLSAEDTAAVLGLSIPAFKARLLRGRLMLREALAPHFAAASGNAKEAHVDHLLGFSQRD